MCVNAGEGLIHIILLHTHPSWRQRFHKGLLIFTGSNSKAYWDKGSGGAVILPQVVDTAISLEGQEFTILSSLLFLSEGDFWVCNTLLSSLWELAVWRGALQRGSLAISWLGLGASRHVELHAEGPHCPIIGAHPPSPPAEPSFWSAE